MHRVIIPDIIEEHAVLTLKRTDSAFDAANMMKESNIAAVLVTDDDSKLEGIVTERDLTRRVVADGMDPKKTPLEDIMTADPAILDPTDSAGDALEIMRKRSFRHLPVSRDGKVLGMVSIRDLYAAVKADLEADIKETEAFVFGDRYSA
jgi:signal-transduction protein with cAMP-binding, CBS, and nucleotidyltransferase domain